MYTYIFCSFDTDQVKVLFSSLVTVGGCNELDSLNSRFYKMVELFLRTLKCCLDSVSLRSALC